MMPDIHDSPRRCVRQVPTITFGRGVHYVPVSLPAAPWDAETASMLDRPETNPATPPIRGADRSRTRMSVDAVVGIFRRASMETWK